MEIEAILNEIQKSCNTFTEENLQIILNHLEQNKTEINSDFQSIKTDHIKPKSCGIYAFYIKPQETISGFEELNDLWLADNDENNNKLFSPKAIKSRVKEPLKAGEQICFYVGKSEDLATRIQQHIHQKTKNTTYGLKLSEHKRLHSSNTFSYSYYVISESSKKYIDGLKCILATLEKELRKELKPLIGKQ